MFAGGNGKDNIVGGASRDTIDGGNGKDTIVGGRGVDLISGGAGADTLIFRANHGDDTVTDFHGDILDLSALGTDFASLVIADTIDGDAVIDTGAGTITLQGVASADFGADDFLF